LFVSLMENNYHRPDVPQKELVMCRI